MSRWILQSAASDSDPISFERLAQLLADGKIDETDLLRPEHGDDWQAVDSVIGLSRAADKLRSSNSVTADSPVDIELVPAASSNKAAKRGPLVPAPLSWRRVLLMCLGIGLAGWGGWWYWFDSYRFPKPAHLAKSEEGFVLPLMGAVSSFEATLLVADTVAIIAFAVWWLRSKRRSE